MRTRLAIFTTTLACAALGGGCDSTPKTTPKTTPADVGAATPPVTAPPPRDAESSPAADASPTDAGADSPRDAGREEAAADAPALEDAARDAPPSDAGPTTDYAPYTNDKWGFTVEYPTLFSQKLASGPGQTFRWGAKAELYVWGAHYKTTPIESLYADWTRRPTLDFKELKGNAFVVRGKEGGRLFYSKSVLQDGILTTVSFDYAPDLKEWIQPVIEHVVESLKFEPLGYRKK